MWWCTDDKCQNTYLSFIYGPTVDPIPEFGVFANQSSKSITVTVKPGKKVHARLCYKKSEFHCSGVPDSPLVTVSISVTFICMYALLFVHTKCLTLFSFFLL